MFFSIAYESFTDTTLSKILTAKTFAFSRACSSLIFYSYNTNNSSYNSIMNGMVTIQNITDMTLITLAYFESLS